MDGETKQTIYIFFFSSLVIFPMISPNARVTTSGLLSKIT